MPFPNIDLDTLFALLKLLWEGFQLIGAAFVGLIRLLLGFFHISLPDWVVELAGIGLLIFFAFRYGKHLGKFLLIVLLILLASTFVQLLIP